MGLRGPPRQHLSGYYRPSRHDRQGLPVQALDAVGKPPAGLDAASRRLWRETEASAFWLRQVDRPLLLVYVEAVARWRRMVEAAKSAPVDDIDKAQQRIRRAALDVRETARALALPPAARQRLTAEAEPDEGNPFMKFSVIRGGRG
jgi:phage terminase small subunit